MRLHRFYPIFPDASWLERTLPLGVKMVQLRIKDASEAELRRELTRGRDLCRAHGAQLVVNDHWRMALDLGCDAVHLGQEDLDEADLSALSAQGVALGLSTHDEAELERALALEPTYVALGPIYPTRLKKMRFGPQGLERLGQWRRRIGSLPLVGIGGLSVERAPGAFAAGADILSVVTDITLHADPEARVKAWLDASRHSA